MVETGMILSYLRQRNTTLGPVVGPILAILSDLPPFLPFLCVTIPPVQLVRRQLWASQSEHVIS